MVESRVRCLARRRSIDALARRLRSLYRSSSVRTGLAIILIEAILLAAPGAYYAGQMISEIEQRTAARIEMPGRLMEEGLLRLASVSDRGTMTRLVGSDLTTAMIVARNLDIIYALDPDLVGRNAAEIPGVDRGWFSSIGAGPRTLASAANGGRALAGIALLRPPDSAASSLYSIIMIDGVDVAREKAAAWRTVLLASLFCLGVTALLVFTLLGKREAELASRAKSRFMAIVSHELRTPLNAIIGILDLLQADEGPGKRRNLVGLCQDSAAALMCLIDDILDSAKIEAGASKLVPAAFSPAELVAEVTELLGVKAAEHGLELTACVDPNLPSLLSGDRLRIKQILLNLVGNAIKFTPKGYVAITVALEAADGKACSVLTEISDSGEGLSDAEQARLFRPFVQLEEGMARRTGGVGLGLSICRELVALMDGTIGVRSQRGQGSTFWFRLRLPILEPAGVVTPQSAPSGEFAPEPARILIVEDNPINRLVLRNLVQHLGHRGDLADDGPRGWEMYEKAQYDLVLTDCHMPEMSGFDLARRIRAKEGADGPHVPIVALTADIGDETEQLCRAAGIDDRICKPIRLAELERVVGACLVDPARRSVAEIERPEEAVILDPAPVEAACGGDPLERDEIFDLFLSTSGQLLDKLRAALAAGHLLEGEEAAQAVGGIAYMIGAYRLGGMCAAIERHLRNGERDEAARAEHDLMRAFARTRSEITALSEREALVEPQEAAE